MAQLKELNSHYTTGSSNIAGWKMGAPECFVDVFPINNGDIPAIAMLVYQRVYTGCFSKIPDKEICVPKNPKTPQVSGYFEDPQKHPCYRNRFIHQKKLEGRMILRGV